MAGQTKMIIITSDEDIIRQFSFNKTKNTHIIDLDNDKQQTSTETNGNNILNTTLHTELSKSNSSNDQVYKRALDSPQHNPNKPVKASKKSTHMICAVCGNQAIGYNYDVLSCASCKAFFHRNANQNPEKIRCLTGQGQCSVTHEVPRKCTKCRLERCFAAGMRKDFFRSAEEKQRRKILLEENRNLTVQRLSTTEYTNTSSSIVQSASNSESFSPISDEIDRLLMDVERVDGDIVLQPNNESLGIEEILFGKLSVEDWITIQSVQSLFVSVFHFPIERHSVHIDLSNRSSALISWSEFGNQLAQRFISFFRQVNEFQDLLLDDRLILIKYNLLAVFPISKCYNYKYRNDCRSLDPPEEAERHQRFFKLFDAPSTILDTFRDLVLSLVHVTGQDPTLLSILLIILILTPGLSMNEKEPPLNDPLAVYKVQCYYTKILWNYFVNQWGELESCRRFTQLLTLILQLQLKNEILWLFFRDEFVKANTVDKLAPLMQSVLNIA